MRNGDAVPLTNDEPAPPGSNVSASVFIAGPFVPDANAFNSVQSGLPAGMNGVIRVSLRHWASMMSQPKRGDRNIAMTAAICSWSVNSAQQKKLISAISDSIQDQQWVICVGTGAELIIPSGNRIHRALGARP